MLSWQLGCLGLVAHGMWYLPRPGIESVSSALAGEFLTTGPLGKSLIFLFAYKNPWDSMINIYQFN